MKITQNMFISFLTPLPEVWQTLGSGTSWNSGALPTETETATLVG